MLRALLDRLLLAMSRQPEKRPPWQQFPHIPMGSLGWRMGAGEQYWIEFDAWFESLSPEAKRRYARRNPAPPSFNSHTDYYASRGVIDVRVP